MTAIAYFITAHGYGHATRACSVMSALHSLDASIRFEIFTQAPAWVFNVSLSGPFSIHVQTTDVGIVQKSPFEEDLEETISRLNAFIPFDPLLVNSLAKQVKELGCRLVIGDIAPLAIPVAQAAGVPSVLVENFTWDWIYAGYQAGEPRFGKIIPYFQRIFRSASYHIQTEPVCAPVQNADLLTGPAGRKARIPRSEIRKRLGVPEQAKMVLVTLGGIYAPIELAPQGKNAEDLYLVIPGENAQPGRPGKAVITPRHSDFYHPDLVNASDWIIGKAGYSTLAEAYLAGVPFIFITRSLFRETAVIAEFIKKELQGFEVSEADFYNGNWISALSQFPGKRLLSATRPNGADQIARFLLDLG